MPYRALLRLEPCAGKLACTVLRGLGAGNCSRLLDYNKVCRENLITHIGCRDHARRTFAEVSKADIAIGKIREPYVIEDKIKDCDDEQKAQQRRQLSRPLLEELKAWLERNISRVPRDSLTHKAISYTSNQWDYLSGYCEDGKLRKNNALAENAIRPFAVGRRDWLFSDTPRGARASATCYSLIATAKATGLEP